MKHYWGGHIGKMLTLEVTPLRLAKRDMSVQGLEITVSKHDTTNITADEEFIVTLKLDGDIAVITRSNKE